MLKTLKPFFEKNQPGLLLLLSLFMVLSLSLELPYVNLFLSSSFIVLFLIFWSFILFRIPSQFLFKLCLFLLFICSVFLLMGVGDEAGTLGNLIYGLLFFGVTQELIDFLKKDQK